MVCFLWTYGAAAQTTSLASEQSGFQLFGSSVIPSWQRGLEIS